MTVAGVDEVLLYGEGGSKEGEGYADVIGDKSVRCYVVPGRREEGKRGVCKHFRG